MTAPSSIDPAHFLHEQLAQASPDLLRQMLMTFINTLMSAEADAVCGAEYGARSAERVNIRNGYRTREFDTRAGTLEVAIPEAPFGQLLSGLAAGAPPPGGAGADHGGRHLLPAGRLERLSRVSWKLRWRSPARTGREVGVGRPPRHHRQGTAVTKKYQNEKIDTRAGGDGFVVPERVSVAMAEIAGSMRKGLLTLAVGTGLQVMQVLMDADVTALAGPKGKHDSNRSAVRHGSERGSVTLGGRRVPVSRPRGRAANGTGELPVPTYEL